MTKPRHSQEVKAAANKRFEELAMPLTVAAEFKVPYRTAWGWRQKWLLEKNGQESNADPGDAA